MILKLFHTNNKVNKFVKTKCQNFELLLQIHFAHNLYIVNLFLKSHEKSISF